MEQKAYCEGCLSVGRKLHPVVSLLPFIHQTKLAELKSSGGGICWECKASLMKFVKFKKKVIRAQDVLKQFRQTKPYLLTLSSIGKTTTLNINLTESEINPQGSYDPLLTENAPIKLEIKEEPETFSMHTENKTKLNIIDQAHTSRESHVGNLPEITTVYTEVKKEPESDSDVEFKYEIPVNTIGSTTCASTSKQTLAGEKSLNERRKENAGPNSKCLNKDGKKEFKFLDDKIEYNANGVPKCSECGGLYPDKRSLQRHRERMHRAQYNKYTCDICKKCFKTKSRMVHHISTHDAAIARRLAYCETCKVQYSSRYGYEAHLKNNANHSTGGAGSDTSSSDEEFVKKEAISLMENLMLPEHSKERYLKSYDDFNKWRDENNVKSLSEHVFIVYFNELSKTRKPSTLWAVYSMLKATMSTKHNIDLGKYTKVRALLRKYAQGFKSEKPKVFTAQELGRYLRDAPDEIYLGAKVASIFAISGSCTSKQLTNLRLKDVEAANNLIVVKLTNTKSKVDRFVLRDEFVGIVKKYLSLRLAVQCTSDRFFFTLRKGKCVNQVIGKNKMAAIPKEIANWLKLPDAKSYTGHSFRNTSVKYLAEAATYLIGSITSVTADGCTNEATEIKVESSQITGNIGLTTSEPQPGCFNQSDNNLGSNTMMVENTPQVAQSQNIAQQSMFHFVDASFS